MDRDTAFRTAFAAVVEKYTGRNKGTVKTFAAVTPRRIYTTERTVLGTPARAPRGR